MNYITKVDWSQRLLKMCKNLHKINPITYEIITSKANNIFMCFNQDLSINEPIFFQPKSQTELIMHKLIPLIQMLVYLDNELFNQTFSRKSFFFFNFLNYKYCRYEEDF